ncbi:MAG: M16 family metallopeptidase [Fusobacteriaceae bacterium]
MIEIKYLKNGIPVLMERVEDIKSFTMGIFVKTGAINETPDEYGISHYIEHMLFKGTDKYSAKELSELVDDNGGSINAYTSRDTTCYYVKMLSSKLDVALEVFHEMFENSTFTEENLEKERNVILEEIKMYEDIPEEVVHDENIDFVLRNLYGNNVLGSEESLKGIDREKFMNYFNGRYVPENMGISIAGNINLDEVFEKLENSFGNIEKKALRPAPTEKFWINTGENYIARDCNQVHLCFNTPGLSMLDEKRYALSILSNVLGENMSSRLFQKIREERGLAYSVYCYTTNYREGGVFSVYAGTSKENYKEVIELIKEELALIKANSLEPRELERAKNQIISMLTFALENSRGKMVRMWNSYLLYGKVITVEEINEIISKVTLEDIKALAEEIFDENRYSITVLGEL